MDATIYKKMLDLKTSRNSKNVYFCGTIELKDFNSIINQNIPNSYDIFMSIEENDNNTIYKFYTQNNELFAIDQNNGQGLIPSSKFVDLLSEDLKQQLSNFLYNPRNSLNQFDNYLETISQSLGISKDKIQAVSESQYSQNLSKPESPDKIHVQKEGEDNHQTAPKEEKKLQALEKQQTNLSQKVDDVHTLGDILGVPEEGTLVAVYSNSIENSTNKNTTKFSFLIKDKDGNYKECPNIEQVGAALPNAQVASSNENGDQVVQQNVDSLYKIKSSNQIEYMLSAKIGSTGTLDLGIGQRDRTKNLNSNDLVTVTTPLKTTSTFHTSPEALKTINGTHFGTNQSSRRAQEGKPHSKCNYPHSMYTYDGDFSTISDEELEEYANQIYNSDESIPYAYSIEGIKKELKAMIEKETITSFEEREAIISKVIHELSLDCSRVSTRGFFN